MPRLIFRSLVAIILLLIARSALAQSGGATRSMSGEIHGQVRLAVNGAQAKDVLVRLESFRGGVVGQIMTDQSGKFKFSGLRPDLYVVIVRAVGFKDSQQQVDLQTTPSAYLVFQLTADASASSAPAGTSSPVDATVPAKARKEFEEGRADLLEKKKIESGLRHLEKAINLYPDFLEAQLLLGTAYMDAKRWDKAEQALRRALELEPQTAAAFFALGELYLQQGRATEAEKPILDGLKLEDSWQGHFALGKTYWALGDATRALPHATRAHELKPDFPQVHLLMGNVLLRQREPQRALAEFEDYLKLDPDGPFAAQTRQLVERIRQALAAPGD
jgi:Flp pilus assembly protein TadD